MFAYFKERQLQEAGLCRNIDKIISWHSEVIKSIDNYSKYPEKEKRSLWNRIHNESNGYLTNITKVITEYLQYEEEYNQAPSCKIDTNALFKMYEKVYDTSLRLSEATKQREKNIQKWMNIKTKQNHNVARHLKYLKPYARNPTPSANYNKFRPSSARTAPTLKSELLNIQIINRPQTAYQKANGTLKPHILREFSRIAGYKRYGLNTWAKNAKGKLSTRQPAPHLRGLKPWIQNAQGKLSTRQPAPRRRQPAPRPGSAPSRTAAGIVPQSRPLSASGSRKPTKQNIQKDSELIRLKNKNLHNYSTRKLLDMRNHIASLKKSHILTETELDKLKFDLDTTLLSKITSVLLSPNAKQYSDNELLNMQKALSTIQKEPLQYIKGINPELSLMKYRLELNRMRDMMTILREQSTNPMPSYEQNYEKLKQEARNTQKSLNRVKCTGAL